MLPRLQQRGMTQIFNLMDVKHQTHATTNKMNPNAYTAVTPSRKAVPQEPRMYIFAKWSGTWLHRSYGVCVAVTDTNTYTDYFIIVSFPTQENGFIYINKYYTNIIGVYIYMYVTLLVPRRLPRIHPATPTCMHNSHTLY